MHWQHLDAISLEGEVVRLVAQAFDLPTLPLAKSPPLADASAEVPLGAIGIEGVAVKNLKSLLGAQMPLPGATALAVNTLQGPLCNSGQACLSDDPPTAASEPPCRCWGSSWLLACSAAAGDGCRLRWLTIKDVAAAAKRAAAVRGYTLASGSPTTGTPAASAPPRG